MILFMSGALTMSFLVGALFFLKFYRKTADRLFLAFSIAFSLMALNQALAQYIGSADERVGYTYLLRVLGFILILAAIIDKNVPAGRP